MCAKYSKSEDELTELFVKVNGDVQSMKDYLEGKKVVQWSYLEDLALTKSETSDEFKCLLKQKGREEIDKRLQFLMQGQDDEDEDMEI